ncbi:MAG: hypothetical protein H7A47_00715 [Verrucomicrobiales bacterium]|nr:hypothetical protein [Verrucomicrobiales bacterium]
MKKTNITNRRWRAPLLLAASAGLLSAGHAGHLVRNQYWDSWDASGNQTADVHTFLAVTYPLYVGFPSEQNALSRRAETPTNVADDYGSEIRGYVIAPLDGDYTFTMASDDGGALWVTTSATVPADFPSQLGAYRAPDAEETGYTSGDMWTAARLDERTTGVFSLTKGQTVYFEFFCQEASGGDYMRLGWTRPDGVQEVIPGELLIPAEADGTSFAFANGEPVGYAGEQRPVSGPVNTTIAEGESTVVKVDVMGGAAPYTFQWKLNGADLPGATLPFIAIDKASIDLNGNRYSCVARDGSGATLTSAQGTLTVQADNQGPRLLGARGSGNPQGIVVLFDEAVDPASAGDPDNYALSGQTVAVGEVTLLDDFSVLLTVGDFTNDPLTLTVNGVTDTSAGRNPIAADSQTRVAFASTLEGYWPMDQRFNPLVSDVIAGNDGVPVDEPVQTTDTPSLGVRSNPYAYEFDGVNDYFQTPYPGVGGVKARTVSFWAKLNVAADETIIDNGILSWGNSTGNGLKYHIRIEPSTGTLRTEAQGGNNWATQDLRDGQWHHLVSLLPELETPGNDNVEHYVDGVLDPRLGGANVAINTDVTSASAIPFRIGARDQTGTLRPFPGLLDDVAVYSEALSADQIAQLAQGTDPREFGQNIATQIALDTPPADATVNEHDAVTFDVAASGSLVIGYQWYNNDAPIPGATGPSLTLDPVSADSDGTIRVDVFNTDGTFARRSATAQLTVIADLAPPQIVSLRAAGSGLDVVLIAFDEVVDSASATDPANYSIGGVTISSATLDATGMTVTLHTSPLTDGDAYTVSINGVKDTSAAGNTVNVTREIVSRALLVDQVLADGPMRFWRFDEGAGAARLASEVTVLDALSLGEIVNIQGAPELIAASLLPSEPAGHAVGLDGSLAAQRLIAPSGTDINTTSGPWDKKSFELWFVASSLPSSDLPNADQCWGLFEQGGGDRAVSLYLFGTQPGPDPQEADLVFFPFNRLDDGAGSPWGDPASPDTLIHVRASVQPNMLYHVVGVMDGDDSDAVDGDGRLLGHVKLYLNGELVDDQPGAGLLYNHTSDVQIGRGNFRNHANYSGNQGWFDGVVDEVALYNIALPADRVAAHYDAAYNLVPGGDVRIVQDPQDLRTEENTVARFTAQFSGSAPWTVRWYLDNQPIRGGLGSVSFLATADMDGKKVKVEISNGASTATSAEATLTVFVDNAPPQLLAAQGKSGTINEVHLTFDEPLDQASAETVANYTIPGLTVNSATLDVDRVSVILVTSAQTTGTEYQLTIDGVKDISVNGNALTTTAPFTAAVNYWDEVFKDAPDLHFSLSDRSGPVVDATGNDVAYVGTPTANVGFGADRLVVGAPDLAMEFRAARTDVLNFNTDSTFVNGGGPWEDKTIEFWFKALSLPRFDAISGLPQRMVIWEQGGNTRGITLYLAGTQDSANPTEADLVLHAWNNANDGSNVGAPWGHPSGLSGGIPVYVRTAVRANQTYHVVFVMDGDSSFNGTLEGYVNGQQIAMSFFENFGVGLLYGHGDNSGLGGVNQNAVYLEGNSGITGNGDYFDGIIDELSFYNTVLPADRVQVHYNTGLIEVPIDLPKEDPEITSVIIAGGTVTIEWVNEGELQSAPAVTGPWTTIAGATSPHQEAVVVDGAKFYRVVRND